MHTLTFSWAESWHNAVLVTHQADFHLLLILNCKEWRMHSTPGEYKWLKTLVTTNGSPTCAHTKFFTQLFGKSPIEWYTTKRFFMTIFQCWGFHTGYVDNEFGFFPQTTLLQVFVPVFQLSILSGYCNWFLLAPLGVSEMLRPVYDIPCMYSSILRSEDTFSFHRSADTGYFQWFFEIWLFMSDFFSKLPARNPDILHLEMLWTPRTCFIPGQNHLSGVEQVMRCNVVHSFWCPGTCWYGTCWCWYGTCWYGSLWLALNSSWELLVVWTTCSNHQSTNQSIGSNYSTFSAFDICSSQKRANKLLLPRPNNCEVWSLSWVSITFRKKHDVFAFLRGTFKAPHIPRNVYEADMAKKLRNRETFEMELCCCGKERYSGNLILWCRFW